ncbi:MAG: glycosyltransferase family 2 protein [bacterium]|nr:glycosyltransferase family 2 protein [bacterium]
MPRPVPELSMVFPVWNEQDNVEALLHAALDLGKQLSGPFEIVVVDDGSRDESRAMVASLEQEHPEIRLVTHPSNRGYGAALRSGLRAARGRWVFFSDADLQFDLNELHRLLGHTDTFDIVAGVRTPRRDPWGRRLLAGGWGLLVRGLFDLPVRDIDCAFKLFRREVIDAIPIASIGAFINTEILVRARHAGFRIHQVPVSHRPRQRGQQSGAHPRVVWRAGVELATLYRELRAPDATATPTRAKP